MLASAAAAPIFSSMIVRREQGGAALCAAAMVGLIGWALVRGLAVGLLLPAATEVKPFELTPPMPVERVRPVPPPQRSRRPEGEAAPPNLRSQATQVVAPDPVVPLPVPPPVIAAPVAGEGGDPTQGAADRPGPGTGAGGIGQGRGSGGAGDGDGGGARDDTPPRRTRDRYRASDIPDFLEGNATVAVRYHVEVNGRVTGCVVTGSSGDPRVDAATCAVIEKRFRYDPSRDPEGRPVRSTVVIDFDWDVEDALRPR